MQSIKSAQTILMTFKCRIPVTSRIQNIFIIIELLNSHSYRLGHNYFDQNQLFKAKRRLSEDEMIYTCSLDRHYVVMNILLIQILMSYSLCTCKRDLNKLNNRILRKYRLLTNLNIFSF